MNTKKFEAMAQTLIWLMIVLICAQSASAEVTSGLKKLKDIIIYKDPSYYSAFPSLVVRDDGEVLCAFRRAPDRCALLKASSYTHTDPNSYLVLVRSNDCGETWTKEPELIFAHPLGGSQDPCMVGLSDGSIVCTSYGWALMPPESTEMKVKFTLGDFFGLGGFVLRSDDGGKLWKGPFTPISLPGSTAKNAVGKPHPASNRGAMVEGKDGRLYWAVKRNDLSVHLLISSDRGQTWTYSCIIAQDAKIGFSETSLIQTKNGDFIAFMRTKGLDGRLAYARSTDGGKSFGQWQDGKFFGYPSQAISLNDGRTLLVYGYRKAPFGIRAKILNTECTDVITAPEYILRDDGGSGDIGYPWAAQLIDGRVLVVYYFNKDNDTRYIAGSILGIQ